MNMKRFVLKFLLLIVPVTAAFLIMNALYEKTNYWKSKDFATKYTDAPYELEFGNFGSSIPCYALKYDAVPDLKAWNFANVTEVYSWTIRVLKNYINHFAKGAVIVLELPYAELEHRPSSFRERYYRFLPKEDMDKWSFTEWLAYSRFPFVTAGKDKMRIFKDITKEEMSPYYDRDDSMEAQRLNEFADNAYEGLKDDPKSGYDENFAELCQLIDMCYAYGAVPVVVSFPQTDFVTEGYASDPNFFTLFSRFTGALKKRYPDLLYLDYSRDSEYETHYECFYDAIHMNNFGAEKFTKRLVGDLRARGVLK